MSSLVGRELDDNYRLEALIGDGGMGAVYRAYDVNLDRVVAIKVMHGHFARQSQFRARLRQEAKAVASLDHPSVVRVIDYGEDDGLAYIVMEYIRGGSLRSHLQRLQEREQVLPLSVSLQIAYQIAEALDYAHRQGIIHRDVKPGNILLKRLSRPEETGEQPLRAVLTDFGLVKLLEGENITQSGTTLGTPAYMSPEQCRGDELDGRSDLYSLGVVLYELLTNRLPFRFNSLADAIATHMRGDMPTPVRLLRPEIPAVVDAIVMKALAKDPSARFISGDAMAAALRSAIFSLSGEPTRVMPEEERSAPTPMAAPEGYRLVIETPGHAPVRVALVRPVVTLGRDSENDIVLPAEGVSRRHARLEAAGDGWELIDLGGVNGTRVDGERLPANRPTRVMPGERIRVGPYTLVLEQPEVAPAEQPQPATPSPETVVEPASEAASEPASPARPPLELFLARDRIAVNPGERATFSVEIVNRSAVDDRVTLQVTGLPEGWVAVPEDFIAVPAGETRQVTLTVRPPRHTELPAGRQRFRLSVRSQQHPEVDAATSGSLMLGAFESFEARLEPQEVRLPAVVHVFLQNTGNAPAEYSVVGRDRARTLNFAGERGRIRLEPQQQATVDLALEAQDQPLVTAGEPQPFEIQVSTRSGAQQVLAGTALVPPIVPPWLSYPLLILTVFSCVFAGLLLLVGERGGDLFDREGRARAALTATAVEAANVNATVAAGATIQAATLQAASPTPGGDLDDDGLSDDQELLLGTDLRDPDSDDDGLRDGPEVLDFGCNPLERDTDGDFLNDWEEVNIYDTDCSDPDTDDDGILDGVEVTQGLDPTQPLTPTPTVTGTGTATPTGTVTGTPTTSPTPSDTPIPSITPSATSTAAPTSTFTPQPTGTATPPPTATPSPTPSVSPTPSFTPTPTATPIPQLVCLSRPPVVDGDLENRPWAEALAFIYDSPDAPGRPIAVYLGKETAALYFAFVISDPQVDPTDGLRIYLDTNHNQGDPDEEDWLFIIEQDGDTAVERGIGDNDDNLLFEPVTFDGWLAQVDTFGQSQWLVEIGIELEALDGIADPANPFGMMFMVTFGDAVAVWPEDAELEELDTWAEIENPDCS
ncbi:MAG: protein kinase [Candidatus Promineifilaceae bacterium]|nr:protein kinase [Candidatus Promineifilaceae bacterium]